MAAASCLVQDHVTTVGGFGKACLEYRVVNVLLNYVMSLQKSSVESHKIVPGKVSQSRTG
jgi:hypothetical protein